jgi:serine protease 16
MACTAPLCNYAKICTHMLGEEVGATGAEAALRRLASLNARRRNGDCVDASYATDVAGLTDVSLEGGDARVWFYQTCTEFGFYQVCDPDSQCPFTSSPWLNRLPTWFAQCELAYNISAAATEAFVARSNLWTGGRNPEGSRVLFVNGEVDPWKAASILTALPSHLFPTIEVRGASHHQWTHPPQPTDSAELLRAREDISRQVGAWLSDASGGSDEAHVLASAHRKIVA